MHLRLRILASGLTLLLSVASLRADLAFALTPSLRLGGSNEVFFAGALSNTCPTASLLLNDLRISFTGGATNYLMADTNAFFANVPGVLLPGETYTDIVFGVVLNPAIPPGDYYGTITLAGGTNIFSTNSLAAQTLEAPTAAGLAANVTVYQIPAGVSLLVKISDLMTNVSDAAGDSAAWAGTSLVTTNGVNLVTNDTYVFYPKSAVPDVADSFTYYVSDSVGRTATGTVEIIPASVSGQTMASITVNGGGPNLTFFGVPGFQYEIQRGTNAANTIDWATIWTTNAPGTGVFTFMDDFGDLGGIGNAPPSAYYRLVSP